MIEITPSLSIDDSEVQFEFVRSSGPGGQNVNKVATGVQLRFALDASPSLSEEVKLRLREIARNRISEDGILIIEAKRFRTQEQNRADALLRLADIVRQAVQPPKPRRKTRPTAASKARRLDEKRKRGEVKRLRRNHPETNE